MTRNKAVFVLILLLSAAAFVIYFFFLRPANDLERMARKINQLVQTTSIAENMKTLAAKPHRAGTPENYVVANRIISELQSAGAKVWTTEYSAYLPQPGNASLSLTAPVEQNIDFAEKEIAEDPYSQIAKQEQPFFAYTPDTDTEAEVVYANYGNRKDYETLKNKGVSVTGKIALVRAQGICRGMKQMIAEEQGLAALLLYPEPKDQGFKKPPYPNGPGINPWLAQRGTMLKFFMYPGDPDVHIEDRTERTLPTVPALPINPEAAQMILKHLGGALIPEWTGWMKVNYRSGPGAARVRFIYSSQRKKLPFRNIFATIGGLNPSDPVLMISTHYDAWVYGASDPVSGTAVVLEAAKALLDLEKKGWKPRRDIVFAFWDAEEYGMLGSTQWVWNHLTEARSRIGNVLYIDSVRGPMFSARVLPGMRGLLDEVLRHFKDPNTGKSVSDFHMAHGMPGYSDDTIPFSNLAGVPVAQLNYSPHYTMYHSLYDNLSWFQKFGDPGYAYSANLARIVALYSIALTREQRLPFRISEFASHYENELSLMLKEKIQGESTIHMHKAIQSIRVLGTLGAKLEAFDFDQLTGKDRQRVNLLLHQAVVSFTEVPGETSTPFRLRNVMLGPLPENECGGTGLPGLQHALLRKEGLNGELIRLSQHFSTATEILQQVIALLEARDGR